VSDDKASYEVKKVWFTQAPLCRVQLGENLNQHGITAFHEAAHAIGWGGIYKDDNDPAFDNLPPDTKVHPNATGWGIPGEGVD
jgi:hypothetical protein